MKHYLRDTYGPEFESHATGLGFDIAHNSCECGSASCAYKHPGTGDAFIGFCLGKGAKFVDETNEDDEPSLFPFVILIRPNRKE